MTTLDDPLVTKVREFGQPPPSLDGRPHFLDAAYKQVHRFGNRPGGHRGRDRDTTHSLQREEGQRETDDATIQPTEEKTTAVNQAAQAGPSNQANVDVEEEEDPTSTSSPRSSSSPSSSSTDSEWEYEDLPPELVIFDLGPESSKLLQSKRHWSSTGLETSTPLLKVGNVVFRGTWQESLGTSLVLRDEMDRTRAYPNQHHPEPLSVVGLPTTTHNRIMFRPAVNVDAQEELTVVGRSGRLGDSAKRERHASSSKSMDVDGVNVQREKTSDGASVHTKDDGVEDPSPESDEQPEASSSSPAAVGVAASLVPTRKAGRPPLSLAQRTQKAIQRSLKGPNDQKIPQRLIKKLKLQEKVHASAIAAFAGATSGNGDGNGNGKTDQAGPAFIVEGESPVIEDPEGGGSSAGAKTGAGDAGVGVGGEEGTPNLVQISNNSESEVTFVDLQTGEMKTIKKRGRPKGSGKGSGKGKSKNLQKVQVVRRGKEPTAGVEEDVQALNPEEREEGLAEGGGDDDLADQPVPVSTVDEAQSRSNKGKARQI